MAGQTEQQAIHLSFLGHLWSRLRHQKTQWRRDSARNKKSFVSKWEILSAVGPVVISELAATQTSMNLETLVDPLVQMGGELGTRHRQLAKLRGVKSFQLQSVLKDKEWP